MRLSNFEFFANTAVAVVGATVTPYVASDIHPNPNGPAFASTFTDTNGRWDFPALADGSLYDIKVAFGTSVKWYKGNARLALGHLYDDTTPPPNRNLLENGGADLWLLRGSGVLTLPTSEPGVDNEADNWSAYCGAGDVCTSQMDTIGRMVNSRAAARITYTRAGGQATRQYALADGVFQQLRGQPFAVSAQVFQSAASSRLCVAIDDGVTETVGTITDVVGAWTTISCLKTIANAASKVVVRIRTNRTDTGGRAFYVDNVMGDQTSLVPVFAPEAGDNALVAIRSQHTVVESAPAVDTAPLGVLLNGLAARVRDIVGAAGGDWKDAVPRSLTQLLAEKVAKAGDIMTGQLRIIQSQDGGAGAFNTAGLVVQSLDAAANPAETAGIGLHRAGATGLYLFHLGLTGPTYLRFVTNGGATAVLFHTLNMGANSGLDADSVRTRVPGNGTGNIALANGTPTPDLNAGIFGSQLPAFYLARANHSGTLAPSVISPQGTGSGLDAGLLGGQPRSYYEGLGGGAGSGIPSGLIAAFATAAEIPAGWARYSAADGRLLVGAGLVGENLFTENTPYGSSWAHTHVGNAFGFSTTASLGMSGTATGGPADQSGSSPTTPNGRFVAGGGNALPDNHTHSLNGVGLQVSGTASGTVSGSATGTSAASTLLLPARAVVWARKS